MAIPHSLLLLGLAGCLAGPTQAQNPLRSPPGNDATPVALGFYVVNLGKINQTDETFDIAGLVTMTWRDPRLAFDPGQTGERVKRLSPDQIWVPELTIVNAANLQRRSLIHLSGQPDGSVKCVEFVAVTVSSDFNLRLFPFDAQSAQAIWEPLSTEVQPLTLSTDARANGVSTDSYVGLSEWQIGDVAMDLGERETGASISRA